MGSCLIVPFLVDTVDPRHSATSSTKLSFFTVTAQICPIFLIIKLHHLEEVSITRPQGFFCLSFKETKTTSLF